MMIIREIKAKSILNRSSIGDYTINPYIGCQHSCRYCYADYYTKKIHHVNLDWGSYIFVKINAPSLLLKEIIKKKKGIVYLSSLTDPYQPIEGKYKLTRKLLEILLAYKWPVIIQTKSSLVLRDLDIIRRFNEIEFLDESFLDRANTRKIDSRTIQNMGINIQINKQSTAGFEVKNISDEMTEDVIGYPLPGRSYFATVNFSF